MGRMVLEKRMKVNYSVRRIRKMSLWRYIYMITRNDFVTMVMGEKPVDDGYAKQDYS